MELIGSLPLLRKFKNIIQHTSIEASEMLFYKRILTIIWTAKMSNPDDLNEIEKQRQRTKNIWKKQNSFLSTKWKRQTGT